MSFSTKLFGRNLPKEPLAKVCFTRGSQMHMFPDVDYRFLCSDTAVFAIAFEREKRAYAYYKLRDAEVMQKLREVIQHYKMQNYKGSYVNRDVRDGWSWSFAAYFFDRDTKQISHETAIVSHGSNSGPKDDGLSNIRKVMEDAMKESERLYACDKGGNEIPDLEASVRFCSNDIDYLALNRNSYDGRVDVCFYNIEQSETFQKDFPNMTLAKGYHTIQSALKYCYGGVVMGVGKEAVFYMIMKDGRAERIPIINIVRGEMQTTEQTKEGGIVNFVYAPNKKGKQELYGLDAKGNLISLTWQTPLPDPNEKITHYD